MSSFCMETWAKDLSVQQIFAQKISKKNNQFRCMMVLHIVIRRQTRLWQFREAKLLQTYCSVPHMNCIPKKMSHFMFCNCI